MNTSPYLGLRPFSENEKSLFFGRDQEIHILTDKILAHRLNLLVAASGVGKSSLLQAGVMPVLRDQGLVDLIYHNAWAGDPAQALKESIVQHFTAAGRLADGYQPDMSLPLAQFLQIHALLGVGTVVILLDQFEEFFYYHRHSARREQFIEQLAQAVHDKDSPTAFIFSMREDFAMEMLAFKPWLKDIFDNTYRIEKLSLAAAQLAITEPARAQGCEYAPDLLQQLLNDLGTERREEQLDLARLSTAYLLPAQIEPPHLQIVCQELWQQHASTQLTLADYQRLGRASGILQNYFKNKMTALGREQQRLASLAFDLLVNQHGAKMAYPLQELAQQLHVEEKALEATLDVLQKAAILRRSQRQHQLWYELYHDIFARSIVEWNQDYKKRQLRRKLIVRGSAISAVLLSILLAFDGWQNHHDRHYRLGAETVSDQIELYQGKHDSWDVFHQQHFLYETDYQRSDIEADKRFEAAPLPELAQEMRLQVGQLPLSQRFAAYAGAGLLEPAELVVKAIGQSKNAGMIGNPGDENNKSSGLIGALLALRTAFTNTWLENFPDKTVSERLELLGFVGGDRVISELVSHLNDTDDKIREAAVKALGQKKAIIAIPKILVLLDEKNSDLRQAAARSLGQLHASEAIPKLLILLQDEEATVRSAAAGSLGDMDASIAIPEILPLLDDKEKSVRSSAAYSLGTLQASIAIPKLIALQKDNSDEVRRAATIALTNLANGGAVNDLLVLLDNMDANVRQNTAYSVGSSHIVAAVPKLLELLKDGDSDVRGAAAYSLNLIKPRESIPDLLLSLQDSDSGVRFWIAKTLEEMKIQFDVSAHLPLLTSKDHRIKERAISVFGLMKVKSTIPKLLSLLEDRSKGVREAAVRSLGQMGDDTIIPNLLPLLTDKEPSVRSATVRALSNLKNSTVIPRLLPLLSDKEENVRNATVFALGKLNAITAIPQMLPLLEDNKTSVRSATVFALSNMNSSVAMQQLLLFLGSWDSELRRTSADALGQMKIRMAVPNLLSLLDDEPWARRSYIDPLEQLRANLAIPKLITLLDDTYPDVRWSAITALGKMKATDATAKLLSLLNHRDFSVRSRAAWALGQIQAKTAAPVLLKLLTDKKDGVQTAAALALNRIGVTAAELTHWQTQTLTKARTVLNDARGNVYDKTRVIQAVGAAFLPEAAALLSSQLQSSDLAVLKAALESSASLGTDHPEWLQPAVPRLLELTRHADVGVQLAAVDALRGMITFANGHVLPAVDQPVQARLWQLAQDSKASIQLRLAALDALGDTERRDLGKQMVPLLQDPVLQLRAAFWLAQLDYREALPELQKKLDALVAEKQAWRAKRDATPRRAEDDNSVKKADASWQKTADEYQYAYAIARLAPDAQAIPLLAHPLYQVRRAAQQALAERPSGDLVRALLAYHQAFDPRDLPSPLPYSTYRALDQVLLQLESRGTVKDLAALVAAKKAGINPPMQTQKRAITERLEWTIAELEARLKAGKP